MYKSHSFGNMSQASSSSGGGVAQSYFPIDPTFLPEQLEGGMSVEPTLAVDDVSPVLAVVEDYFPSSDAPFPDLARANLEKALDDLQNKKAFYQQKWFVPSIILGGISVGLGIYIYQNRG
jgi:hypothetical protein